MELFCADSTDLEGVQKLQNLELLTTKQLSKNVGELNIKGLVLDDNNSKYPSLMNFKKLKAFRWVTNNSAEEAPNFIGSLSSLEFIHFDRCSKLTSIPANYNELDSLNKFVMKECKLYLEIEDHLNNIKPVMHVYATGYN